MNKTAMRMFENNILNEIMMYTYICKMREKLSKIYMENNNNSS